MQLIITDSYSQESHSYAVGIEPMETQIASQQTVALPQGVENMGLEGFYQLPVRASDRALLTTCQSR